MTWLTQNIKLWNIQVSIIPVLSRYEKKMLLIDFKIFKRISLNCSKRKISTKIKISLRDRASYGYFCDWLWNRIFNNINRKFGGYKLPVISIAKDRYNDRLRNKGTKLSQREEETTFFIRHFKYARISIFTFSSLRRMSRKS